MSVRLFFSAALAITMVCCNGSTSPGGEEALRPFLGTLRTEAASALDRLAGVYETTSFTRNVESCDVEGFHNVRNEHEPMFVVFPRPGAVAQLKLCDSVEDCRTKTRTSSQPPWMDEWNGYVFSRVDGEKLGGPMASPGHVNRYEGRSKSCIYAFEATGSLTVEGDGVRFERRRSGYDYDFNASDPRACSMKAARVGLAGAPCRELVVIRAKRVADLE